MPLQCSYGATRLYFQPQVSYIRMTASSRSTLQINWYEQIREISPFKEHFIGPVTLYMGALENGLITLDINLVHMNT